jgi:lipoate-protein ligase A
VKCVINRVYIYESNDTNPYHNIATEKYLLENVETGTCILYLWQNRHTVVIGRNQNAWSECRTSLLAEEGGFLARRLSGGGAVFHDMGNLNFTFLVPDEDYDVDRQLSVIMTACDQLGIPVEKSGRNDLLAAGQKFSGNAFYHAQGKAYHHGTLLVDADMNNLGRYLTPSKAKLEAKGVKSVRSRVTNLNSLCPGLTIEELKKQLVIAFGKVYGCEPQPLKLEEPPQIREDAKMLGSWDWLYGKQMPFTFSCEERFDWGSVQIHLQIEAGTVVYAEVYTDAMDWYLAEELELKLTGCRFLAADLEQALAKHPDVLELLKKTM